MRLRLFMVQGTDMDQRLSPFVSTVLHKVFPEENRVGEEGGLQPASQNH